MKNTPKEEAAVLHAVLTDIHGVGVLITGSSGVGKSETALELIKRGHRLVADDVVAIKHSKGALVGFAPPAVRHFMEIRGIGIINISQLFGLGSVIGEKEIELVIELEDWIKGKAYDRIGDEGGFATIEGVRIPKLLIPVAPGRNLAIIMEVAATNFRSKSMGYSAIEDIENRGRL
jgi:HPr kinase/phosphorylase